MSDKTAVWDTGASGRLSFMLGDHLVTVTQNPVVGAKFVIWSKDKRST